MPASTPTRARAGALGLLGGLLLASSALAQAGPGTDFWFSPGFHDTLNPERDTWGTRLDLVADQPAEVVISGYVSWSGTVAPGAPRTVDIARSVTEADDRVVVDKGIHVTSDVPISAVWREWLGYYDDGALLVPTERLGLKYRLLTHPSVGQSYGAGFVITATEDGTTVEYQDPCAPHGSFETVLMGAGQTFVATCLDDPNGAAIRADKPIAVSALTYGEYIPYDRAGCCADPTLAQLWPVASWGTRHRVPRLPKGPEATDLTDDVWIVTAEPGVVVEIESAAGVITDALTADMPVKYELEGPLRIDANAPVQVLVVFQSWYVTNEGDPFALLIPPEGARVPAYRFVVPSFFEFSEKLLVTVIAEDPATADLSLDGLPVGGDWLAVPGTNQAQLDLQVEAGEHLLQASRPVAAFVHGYYIQQSIAFPAAASLELPRCTAEAVAEPLVLCPGEPAVLDGSGSSLLRCAGEAEYRWSQEGLPLGDWSPEPMLEIDPPVGDTLYTLEVRCSGELSCGSSVDVPVRRRPGPPLPGVGNVLRLERDDSADGWSLRLAWPGHASPGLEAEHYHVYEAGRPEGPFLRLDPGHDLVERELLAAAGEGLRFYDLRLADVCETLSEDDYPHSRPSACHGHALACGHSITSALEATCPSEVDDHACAPRATPGAERAQALSLGQPATVRLELVGADPDLLLVLLDDGGACLAADGPVLEADLPAGDYEVLVDAPAGTVGPYTLALSCTP